MLRCTQRFSVSSLVRPRFVLKPIYDNRILTIGHRVAAHSVRTKTQKISNFSTLFQPLEVKTNSDDISVGSELCGKLDKVELLKTLNRFVQHRTIKSLCTENGMDCKCWVAWLFLENVLDNVTISLPQLTCNNKLSPAFDGSAWKRTIYRLICISS